MNIAPPGDAFVELFRRFAPQYTSKDVCDRYFEIIEEKGISEYDLEEEIQSFLNFIDNILGLNITSNLMDEITYRIDRIINLGIDISIAIPNYPKTGETWNSDDAIKELRIKRHYDKLNSQPTVIWNVEILQDIYKEMVNPYSLIVRKDRLTKKDTIRLLKELKARKIILEYVEHDIYCGKPQYRKKRIYDPEFNYWFDFWEEVPPEKSQGNSFQKRKKPFRVCLGNRLFSKTDEWQKVSYYWRD